MKLSCLRNGASGSVDLPNVNSPFCEPAGNQLHSGTLCSAFGSDIPFAVYNAQKRRGICEVTSAPITSRTGSASATPPIPRRKARRSICGNRAIFEFYHHHGGTSGCTRTKIRNRGSAAPGLLLQKYPAVDHVPNHVTGTIPAGLQFEPILLQVHQLAVRQRAAGRIRGQM